MARVHSICNLFYKTEVLLVAVLLQATFSQAQVSPATITESGLSTNVNQYGNTYKITGGTRPGSGGNLFHSFGLFTLHEGDTANFVNTTGPGVMNIISRVTGRQPSQIDGMIKTTYFDRANLFLINPSGIVFGPNASLNVGGSFYASTADYVLLSDKVKFFAKSDSRTDSRLTFAQPEAFGFLNRSHGSYRP